MTVLAVLSGLWILLALCAGALIARTSRGWQDRYDHFPAVDDVLPLEAPSRRGVQGRAPERGPAARGPAAIGWPAGPP